MQHKCKIVFRVEDADTKRVIIPDAQTVLTFDTDEMRAIVYELSSRGGGISAKKAKEHYVATIIAQAFLVVTKHATTKITDWIGKAIVVS